jgi:hypothetical protein
MAAKKFASALMILLDIDVLAALIKQSFPSSSTLKVKLS